MRPQSKKAFFVILEGDADDVRRIDKTQVADVLEDETYGLGFDVDTIHVMPAANLQRFQVADEQGEVQNAEDFLRSLD